MSKTSHHLTPKSTSPSPKTAGQNPTSSSQPNPNASQLGFKFFRHELALFLRSFAVFYLLTLGAALLARFASSLEANGNLVITIFKGFCETFLPPALITTMLTNAAIRLWLRFRLKTYGPESYLTHTLPMKGRSIFLAYLGVAAVVVLLTAGVSLLAVLIAYASPASFDYFFSLCQPIAEMLNIPLASLLVSLAVVLLLEFLCIILIGFLAIILGHRFNNHKALFSLLIGLALYVLLQSLILIIAYLLALHNDQIMAVFQDAPITDFSRLDTVIYLTIIFYTLVNIGIPISASLLLNHGVNIE